MIENPLDYLPHGKEIVAIKDIIKITEQSICCRVLARGSIFNAIEYIAQAAAVGRISNSTTKLPRLGMIIRIREFEVFKNEVCETVECVWSGSLTGVYEVQGKAFAKDGKLLASASMTIMEQA